MVTLLLNRQLYKVVVKEGLQLSTTVTIRLGVGSLLIVIVVGSYFVDVTLLLLMMRVVGKCLKVKASRWKIVKWFCSGTYLTLRKVLQFLITVEHLIVVLRKVVAQIVTTRSGREKRSKVAAQNITSECQFARWLRWLLKISRGNVTSRSGCDRRIINIVVARGEISVRIMI